VNFTGHLEGRELVAAYAAATTLVLPSAKEVWGLVVNEALSAGLHAVVSDACGIVPSIDGLPGVFRTPPQQAGLRLAMTASRRAWRGPLADHPVTRHTPGALADVVLATVADVARARRLAAA
jgi:glycosyltransferase involved in cell wall biosynthesis